MSNGGARHDPPRGLANRLRRVKRSSLRAALATDFREAPTHRRFALVGVIVWLAYEWGPGNETVTPWVLARIISENSGALVIPITAGVGFTFTTLQQLASGFTALAGFSVFDRTSRAAWELLTGKSIEPPGAWNRIGFGARCALVFGLGTTAVALIQIMSTGETGVRRHAPVIWRSAVLCGSIVATIGAIVASLAYIGRRVDAMASETEWMLRLLGNPLFWLGLLLVGAAVRLVQRQFERSDPDTVSSDVSTGG